jgi:hypothetical protein
MNKNANSPSKNTANLNSIIKILSPIIKLFQLSEGKNKLFALFQYVCKFFGTTIIYSIDTTILLETEEMME